MGARNKNRFIHRLSRPSPALIVAIIALIVSMGGTGYAAFTLPNNSVGTKQLKNGAVTAAKVKRHSLTGAQINLKKLGTVPTARDAGRALRAGTAAPTGKAGGALAGTYPNPFIAPAEPVHMVGAAGQVQFDVDWTNVNARASSRPASTRTRSAPCISRATCSAPRAPMPRSSSSLPATARPAGSRTSPPTATAAPPPAWR